MECPITHASLTFDVPRFTSEVIMPFSLTNCPVHLFYLPSQFLLTTSVNGRRITGEIEQRGSQLRSKQPIFPNLSPHENDSASIFGSQEPQRALDDIIVSVAMTTGNSSGDYLESLPNNTKLSQSISKWYYV